MKMLTIQMIFTSQSLLIETMINKEALTIKVNLEITTITRTKEGALTIQGAIEVAVMLREPLIESLTTRIKITKLMKKMVMKCRKKENTTIEAEDLIKRMTLMGLIEEVHIKAIIEGEEVTIKISKNSEKLVEATIIIEEIIEVEEEGTRTIKMNKLNTNPIMRTINHIKIA